MSRKRSERPVGRPNIEIDKDVFERLCAIQCTQVEMACFLGVSEDTIERWCKRTYGVKFAEIFKQKRMAGRVSLRRSQWQMAETSVPMAIFLGKQYLGQSDNPTVQEDVSKDKEPDALSKSLMEMGATLTNDVEDGTNAE